MTRKGKVLFLIISNFFLAPSLVFASQTQGGIYRIMQFIGINDGVSAYLFHWINLAILLFVLHIYARPAIHKALRDKAQKKKEEFAHGQDELKEVQQKTKQIQIQFEELAKTGEKTKATAHQEIQESCKALRTEAHKQVEYWQEAMQQRLETKLLGTKKELQKYMSEEALKLVSQNLEKDDIKLKKDMTNKSIIQLQST